jgi:hypothetical protein
MNPAPDAELASVGEYNHNWIVNEMTDFILRKLKKGFETPAYRWTSMLNPSTKTEKKATVKATVKGKTTKVASKTTTKPKTEKKSQSKNASAK